MNHELHRSFLWHLSYRLTGSTADAEDVVQETLLKSLEAKPNDDRPLRPWLATVASRLSIDRLRQRQARPYLGPWLPGLVLTPDEGEPESESTAGRYDLRESATVAFLVALEVLSAEQRAVLVLRDVFDQSAREVAEVLGLSEDNVRQLHHRARVALEGYDTQRCLADRATLLRSRELLEQLLTALVTGDAALAAKVLRADVRSLSDGGGVYSAARVPVVGFERVYLLYRRLTRASTELVIRVRAVQRAVGAAADLRAFGQSRSAARGTRRGAVERRHQLDLHPADAGQIASPTHTRILMVTLPLGSS